MAPNITVMKRPKDTKGTLLRLISYMGPFRYILLFVVALSLVSNILSLLGPSLAGKAINEAAVGQGKVNFDKVIFYSVRMLFCYAASSLISISISVIMMHTSKGISRNMRRDIFEKLMTLPVGFFDRNQAGDIISRVSYDVDVVGTCIATDLVLIINCSVMVVGSLLMMLYISPLLSVVVLFSIPVTVFYTVKMRKITQPRYSRRSKMYGEMNGFVEEMFSGQKTIQSYAYENHACRRFEEVNNAAAEAYYDADSYGVTMGPTMGFVNNASLGLIATIGALLFMNGRASLGQISSFVLYSRKFAGPINEIANVVNEIFSALSAAERVFNLLNEQEEPKDADDCSELDSVTGNVKLEHVSFGYDPGRTIIHNLSLEALSGKLVAIVGPTGAGKTTIINLLMRFYDVDSGFILVDEKDIRNYSLSSLRGAYAMVLQETWLFNGTIFDNIAYGKEDATMDEVVRAAKVAHIHPFIMRLPEGYNTVVTDDGSNISKGQKQLLTIARAMLYDAKMLILDEATSNVDTSTEKSVQEAMRKLMENKTCFVIAHRLSTIKNADLILVVNNGDVIEQGSHKELMARDGFYRQLYMSQFN